MLGDDDVVNIVGRDPIPFEAKFRRTNKPSIHLMQVKGIDKLFAINRTLWNIPKQTIRGKICRIEDYPLAPNQYMYSVKFFDGFCLNGCKVEWFHSDNVIAEGSKKQLKLEVVL